VRSGLSIPLLGWVRSLGVGTPPAVALWNLNKLRLGYTTEQRVRFLEDERRAERKRIARELHDTLLQGLQGILLEFEVLSSTLPEEERERSSKIERKLRHIVMDGRNAINALRLPDDDKDWMETVLEMGEREALESEIDFTLKIKGEPWKLPLTARVEVLAIVREGLRNAFAHSKAKTILVAIRYAKRGLKISIKDNGVGVSEQHLALRRKEGHWGIAGMQERADRLRGRLTIASQLSKGTLIDLVVPRCLVFTKPCVAGIPPWINLLGSEQNDPS
jgi:signal transduction histidine kinase